MVVPGGEEEKKPVKSGRWMPARMVGERWGMVELLGIRGLEGVLGCSRKFWEVVPWGWL